MEIVTFSREHILSAQEIALQNYKEEAECNPALPEITQTPELDCFAENEMGVCALENGKMLGFLCCYEPWKGAFDPFDELGTFSPVHAHGAIKRNRVDIYQRMYEVAAKRWVGRKIVSHGIALYEHDRDATQAFFEYGFGKRCADQIRPMEHFREVENKELTFEELPLLDFPKVREMRCALNGHLKKSPCFMQSTREEYLNWINRVEAGDRRTFVALDGNRIVAYIDVAEEGETFITYADNMMNIQGAYCLPEYRGKNVVPDLIEYVIGVLKAEGYTHFGVDHESYNPTANRFWKKFFSPYTCSVVRHIEKWADE